MNNRLRVASIITSALVTLLPGLALASFDKDIHYGDHGSDVVSLQEFLIAQGLLSAGSNTGNFFGQTLAAVKAFQNENNVSPASGFFGPLTRAIANSGQNSRTGATTGVMTHPPASSGNTSNTQTSVTNTATIATTPPAGGSITPPSNGDSSSHSALLNALLAQLSQLQTQIKTLQGAGVSQTTNTTNSGTPCLTLDGVSVPSGIAVTMFVMPSVAAGNSCISTSRTCINGTLSGPRDYSYGSCTSATAVTCSLDGVTLQNGTGGAFYSVTSVPTGQSCASFAGTRYCANGTIQGDPTYTHASCTGGTSAGGSTPTTPTNTSSASCTLDGMTIASGQSATFYNSSSVAFGGTCSASPRICSNGVLSGDSSYSHASCSVAQSTPTAGSTSCTFNNQSIASGASVTAYQTSSVVFGQTCLPQTRTCSNGVLSGTNLYATCTVNPQTTTTSTSVGSCTVAGGATYADGSTVAMNPCPGQTCSAIANTNLTCHSGIWYSSNGTPYFSLTGQSPTPAGASLLSTAPTCTISSTFAGGNGSSNTGGYLCHVTWSSQSATSATINNSIGSVAVSGSQYISTNGFSAPIMTVSGPGGSATCQAPSDNYPGVGSGRCSP